MNEYRLKEESAMLSRAPVLVFFS